MFSFSWVSEILSIANIREEKFPCLTYWGEKSPHGGFVHLVSLPKAKTNKKTKTKPKQTRSVIKHYLMSLLCLTAPSPLKKCKEIKIAAFLQT